jgi:hypothetical protein
MGEFFDLMASGFSEVATECGNTVTRSGLSAKCIVTPLETTLAMQASGFFADFSSTIEMLRSEQVRLGLVVRSTAQVAGKWVRVVQVDDDPDEPCVRLMLKEEQPTAVPR